MTFQGWHGMTAHVHAWLPGFDCVRPDAESHSTPLERLETYRRK